MDSVTEECQGYISAFNELSKDKAHELASVLPPPLSGVEQSVEILEWIWNSFSAVGKYSRKFSFFLIVGNAKAFYGVMWTRHVA